MNVDVVGRLFTVAVVAIVALTGCSRTQPEPPHTRLGVPYDGGRSDGAVRWLGAGPQGKAHTGAPHQGSVAQFQSGGFDTVYFASDSVELTPEAQRSLAEQAAWLKRFHSFTILVEGHADERGTREYNIALGQRRAQTVNKFLAAHGISAEVIRTVSYGKERPVATCNDISCWSRNRRAQTILSASAISRR